MSKEERFKKAKTIILSTEEYANHIQSVHDLQEELALKDTWVKHHQKSVENSLNEKNEALKKLENLQGRLKTCEECLASALDYEEQGRKKLDKANERIKELEKNAFMKVIKILRDLQKEYRHESKWSHSRDLKFAPVELSDYVLLQMRKQHTGEE